MYKIYFSIFGKKMKVNIKADSHADAREILKSRITIYMSVKQEPDPVVDFFKEIFGL